LIAPNERINRRRCQAAGHEWSLIMAARNRKICRHTAPAIPCCMRRQIAYTASRCSKLHRPGTDRPRSAAGRSVIAPPAGRPQASGAGCPNAKADSVTGLALGPELNGPRDGERPRTKKRPRVTAEPYKAARRGPRAEILSREEEQDAAGHRQSNR